MHPLTPDLTQLTDDELQTKLSDLQNKLAFSYRSGYSDMVAQLQLVMDDYRLEIEKRNQKMLEQMKRSGRGGADKIDITR